MGRPEMRRTMAWGGLERRIRTEWLIVSLALLLLTFMLGGFGAHLGIAKLDHVFYDRILSFAADKPASNDIVIVAIDDGSIEEIGYWPWRRAIHAQLLARLKEAKAVGLDIVFSDDNPAYPGDDQTLARAITEQGHVVLPLIHDGRTHRVGRPLPVLAASARQLGNISAHFDGDGVIRRIVLREGSPAEKPLDHFVLAMLEAGGDHAVASVLRQSGNTSRLLSYSGGVGGFALYPYAKVLDGEVPQAAFRGKYVLVGSWASGLGDLMPTPLSVRTGEPMAGVEILANGLRDALEDGWIGSLGRWLNALIAVLPVLLVCTMLQRLSPRRSLFISAAMLLFIVAGSWLLLQYAHFWIPPVASLIGVALIYPVWSWRSQEAALQYFDRELGKLRDEGAIHELPDAVVVRPDESLSARVVALHQAISSLSQAARQREQTMRFISHDMRSPQNSILALIELQNCAQTPLPQPEILERIERYANKTLSLVDGFIHLARAESKEMDYREQNLPDMLAAVCDEHWPLAQQRDSRILFEADMDPAYVRADSAMLARAFSNLIDNAIKYSPPGSTVRCRLSGENESWRVTIEDQGRGMSPDEQASLFTPFKRFGEDAPGNPSGSGLGLAFVQAVVARHGGSIQVASAKGQGSTFTVVLPRFEP